MGNFRYDGISIKNQRATNMDSILIKEAIIEGKSFCLAVVCDGVGSLKQGSFASMTTIKLLSKWFDEIKEYDYIGQKLKNRVIEINHEIIKKAQELEINTASTISALVLGEEKYYLVHLGDSRVYSYKTGVMKQLTEDHVKDGKLTSCMGHFDCIDPMYVEGEYYKEWFILCSDGLYKKNDARFMRQELAKLKRRNIKKIAEKLAQYAVNQGEKDNISIAIVSRER